MIRLSGICAALQAADEDRGVRAMSDLAGMAKSTYHASSADPHKLSLAAVLLLADGVPEIKASLLDALTGSVCVGRPSNATRDAFGVMVSGNKALAGLATDLADGTLSPAEARARLPELREHLAQVRRLILDAEAVANCGGSIGGRP